MSSTQLFLSTIILCIIYKTVASYKKEKLSFFFISSWAVIWIVGLIMVLKPSILIFLAQTIGIGRGVDLAIYLSILTIFFGIYRIMARQEKMHQQITKIIRQQAITTAKKKRDS